MGQLRRSTDGSSRRRKDQRRVNPPRQLKPLLKPPVKGRNRMLLDIANRLLTTERSLSIDTADIQSSEETLREMVESYKSIMETEDLSPIHLSTVLFMSIKGAIQEGMRQQLLSQHREFLISVLERLPLTALDSRRLSAVIWAMGQLGPEFRSLEIDGGDYLDKLVQLTAKRLVNFKVKQIVNTISGLASMQCLTIDRFMPTLTATCRLRRSQFSSEELCRLAGALGAMQVQGGQDIMESLAVTVRQKVKSATPSELTQFIWACGRLHVRISSSAMAVFMNKIETNLRILKPREVARVLWASTQIAYRPRFEFLDMVEVYVANQSSAFEPGEIVDCLNALATFSYAPGTLLEVSKAFVLDYKEAFTVKEMMHAIYGMSLLDSLDTSFLNMAIEKVSTVWNHPSLDQGVERMPISTVDDEDLQRLYHCLLHLEFVNGEAVRHLLPTALKDDCCRAWYAGHPLSTGETLSHILHSFEYMGYSVELPQRDPKTGWAVHCIEGREGKVAVEVVTESSCFVNEQHRLQGLQKWKHKILKACGWDTLLIFEDTWMAMDFQEQTLYLSDQMGSIIH